MTQLVLPAEVGDDERVSRYVLFSGWVRQDQTLKPDAFIPYPRPNLSVTRQHGLDDAGVWRYGHQVARARTRGMLGRADFSCAAARQVSLDVVADPLPGNPNHANVTKWPEDKPGQKIRAQLLAQAASYIRAPECTDSGPAASELGSDSRERTQET